MPLRAIAIAGHTAVKVGQALTDGEMSELIRQLEATPHNGRPIMIQLRAVRKKVWLVVVRNKPPFIWWPE
ncbi:hypothetical protein M1N58_03095 [Dehalococcoidales bacterium]|nr:hypothetical protein [Dehalococcoidales bacterium]